MMNHQPSIFYLIVSFLLSINNTSLKAQNIQTAADSLILKACTDMPMATSEYNFSYPSSMLDLKYESKEEEKKTIPVLLEELDQFPHDIALARKIALTYKKNDDLDNYRTYTQYTYKQCLKVYDQYPDSFEVASLLSEILLEGQQLDLALNLMDQYVTTNPKDVRGLSQFALFLATQGKIEKAKHFVEQAYLIDPSYTPIYLSAMMCEFTRVILQISSSMNFASSDTKKTIQNIHIEDDFLKKAIADNASPTAQMSLDAANIFAVFYKTILKALEKEISKEVIHISPSSEDAKTLRAIEKRAQKQLKINVKNTSFAYQTLCIIEILRGNTKKAVHIFEKSGAILESNTGVLRLLSLGYFLVLDYNNAIIYLEKVLSIQTSPDDLYTLGRFYSKKNELEKAYQIFTQTDKLNPLDRKAICAKAAIHIQQGDFDKAFELINTYPDHLKDDINNFHLNYFAALVTLTTGNKNDAFKRFKAIHAQSEYKENADKLLAHFFKAEEKEEK